MKYSRIILFCQYFYDHNLRNAPVEMEKIGVTECCKHLGCMCQSWFWGTLPNFLWAKNAAAAMA